MMYKIMKPLDNHFYHVHPVNLVHSIRRALDE